MIEFDNVSRNAYIFDTRISEKGGELNVTFTVTFHDNDLKLNPDAPQRWIVNLPKGSTWTARAKSGDLSSPVLINVTEGSGIHEVHMILDIIACKTFECIPKKLSIVYRICQKTDASDVVTEQRRLVVK